MTRPSVFRYFRTWRAVALSVTAASFFLASSFRDANAAVPPGGTSSSAEHGQTLQRDSELTRIRSQILAQLRVDGVRLREAQAALDAAKDERSKDNHRAARDHVAASLGRLYGQLIVNWLSLDALYAPPAMRKRLEELAKQTDADLKAKWVPTSAEFFIALDTETLQRESELVEMRSRLLDEVTTIEPRLRQAQSDLETTRGAVQKAATQMEQQQIEVARRQALLQTQIDGLRQRQAALRAESDAQKRAALQVELEDQEKAVVAAERQYTELARQQEALQAQVAAQRRQRDVLQRDLQDLAALRSQHLGRLVENWRQMNALHAPLDVGKRVHERMPKKGTSRDLETMHAVQRILVAADHLHRLGRADVAARVSSEADLLAKRFAAMAQTENQPPTETSGDSPQPKAEPAPVKKVVVLRLLDDKQVLVNNRGKIALDDFKNRLGDAMANYKQQGIQPSAVCVHLSAAENVSCGRFEKLIVDCRENRIEHYILKIEAIYLDPAPRDRRLENAPPIDVRFSLPLREGGAPPANEWPPLVVGLKSKQDGSLAGIWMNEVRLPSNEHLRARAVQLKGGPDGSHAPLTAEFDADEKLAFGHLAEAVLAVSVQVDPFHKLVPLIENVIPIRLPDDLEEIEVFEDAVAPSDDPKASPRPIIKLDNIKLDPPPNRE